MPALEEIFQDYEDELARINNQSRKAREDAKVILHEKLQEIRKAHHNDLKIIRAITQRRRLK